MIKIETSYSHDTSHTVPDSTRSYGVPAANTLKRGDCEIVKIHCSCFYIFFLKLFILTCMDPKQLYRYSTPHTAATPWTLVNPLLPGDTYMHHWNRSTLIQVMASQIMHQAITWTNDDSLTLENIFSEIWIKIYWLSFQKIYLKCCMQSRSHFVPHGCVNCIPMVHQSPTRISYPIQ